MDGRIDPLLALGLALGDAHVLRNAGAVATEDVLRSLAISTRLLGTREIVVVGHTDCGMVDFTNEEIRARLAADGVDAQDVEFYPVSAVDESVRASAERLRESPLIERNVAVSGFVYDVATGGLRRLS